jgi:hypothetical protein
MGLAFLALVTAFAQIPAQAQQASRTSAAANIAQTAPPDGTSATAQLTINSHGRVTGCTILKSTGRQDWDKQTCDALKNQARLKLGKDNAARTSDPPRSPSP